MCEVTIFLTVRGKTSTSVWTYGQEESVLEVGEVSVALLAAVAPVPLVYDLLVAVCSGTGLVQTVLLTHVHDCGHAAEVVGLGRKERKRRKSNYGNGAAGSINSTNSHGNCRDLNV